MDFKFAEQTCKMHARLLLMDQSKRIVIPDGWHWVGFNLLVRDDEIGDTMRRRNAKGNNKTTPAARSTGQCSPHQEREESTSSDGKALSKSVCGRSSEDSVRLVKDSSNFVSSATREYVGKTCSLNDKPARVKAGQGINGLIKSKTESMILSWHALDYGMRESGKFTFYPATVKGDK